MFFVSLPNVAKLIKSLPSWCNFISSASCWVMNERCAPSSNSMLAFVVKRWDFTSAMAVFSNTLFCVWFVEWRIAVLSWDLAVSVLGTIEGSDVGDWLSHMLVWCFLLHWRHLLLKWQAETKCFPRQLKQNFFLLTISIRLRRVVTLLQLVGTRWSPQKTHDVLEPCALNYTPLTLLFPFVRLHR